MTPDAFTEEDYKQTGEFINFVTKNMLTKSWDSSQCIDYVRLLGFMQRTLAPKIYKHILEVEELKKAPPPSKSPVSSRGKSK